MLKGIASASSHFALSFLLMNERISIKTIEEMIAVIESTPAPSPMTALTFSPASLTVTSPMPAIPLERNAAISPMKAAADVAALENNKVDKRCEHTENDIGHGFFVD